MGKSFRHRVVQVLRVVELWWPLEAELLLGRSKGRGWPFMVRNTLFLTD